MKKKQKIPKVKLDKFKFEIRYVDTEVDVDLDALMDYVNADYTDGEIDSAIRDYISEAVTDGPWPTYSTRPDRGDLVAAVRERLAQRKAEDK